MQSCLTPENGLDGKREHTPNPTPNPTNTSNSPQEGDDEQGAAQSQHSALIERKVAVHSHHK